MKYYVIRKGKKTWIFPSRNEVQPLVSGFPDAKFKSFETREGAERAFAGSREEFYNQPSLSLWKKWLANESLEVPFEVSALAVDAACGWNPGVLERRGVEVATGKEIFHHKVERGTNNVGEFLAIVEGIRYVIARNVVTKQSSENEQDWIASPDKSGSQWHAVYSDSKIAMNWVKEGKCKSVLREKEPNLPVWKLVREAEEWLNGQWLVVGGVNLLKWKTNEWGEIPADFGRK